MTDAGTFEDLSEHGEWESSLRKAEPCRPFVDEESRSTRHLDESLGWNEGCFKAFVEMLTGWVADLSDVIGVYRRYHPPARALLRCIAATDRLIAHIVYRLYGLTEEEVAIVEGKTTSDSGNGHQQFRRVREAILSEALPPPDDRIHRELRRVR